MGKVEKAVSYMAHTREGSECRIYCSRARTCFAAGKSSSQLHGRTGARALKVTKFFFLVAIAGVIGLAGCKPKETTITGQVFIAASGGISFRLGAVEVLLIERQEVTNCLQKRHVVISDKIRAVKQAMLEARQRDIADAESQVETCQINVTNAEQKVEDAQKQFDPVQKNYDQFMATQPFLTNTVYVKIKKDLAYRTGIIPSQQQSINSMEKEVNKPYQPQTWVVDNGKGDGHWAGASREEQDEYKRTEGIYLANANNDLANTYARINADQQALAKIENDVDGFQANKLHDAELLLNAAKSDLTKAQSSLAAAKSHLATLESHKNEPPIVTKPTVDDYFYGFTPTVIKKANTDADGNFSLTYPCNKRFTIFARAGRTTLSEHEKYIWLIDAPVKPESTRQLLLNNNNLIEVDPDGYFKTIRMKN